MKTIAKKLYEAMFLVDSSEAAADWDRVTAMIRNIFERADAEIVSIDKWDERRLAYDINGQSRGTYILCYFRAAGDRIGGIERDVQLSERIMRVLILSAEHRKPEDSEKGAPFMPAEETEDKAAGGPAEGVTAKEEGKKGVEGSEAPDDTVDVLEEGSVGSEGLAESDEETGGGDERLRAAGPVAADSGEPVGQEQAEAESQEPGEESGEDTEDKER